MFSTALFVAALLVFAIGAVHSWLGERMLLGPLLAEGRRAGMLDKSEFARGVLRFAWHITTVAWWGMGAILLAYSRMAPDAGQRMGLIVLAVTFLTTGVIILAVSRGRHLAWPVFLAIAGLTLAPVF